MVSEARQCQWTAHASDLYLVTGQGLIWAWGGNRVEGPGWGAGVRCSEKATHPCQPDSGLEPAPFHVKIHSGRFPSTKQNDFFKKPVVYEILDSLWLPGPSTLHATWGKSPNTHKTCVLIHQT